jgi:hypothetical protein
MTAVGNLWQSFGQMAAGDVADLAIRSSGALDKEVMAHLKTEGDWDSRVGLLGRWGLSAAKETASPGN